MSLHRSLKTKPSGLNQHRNVLTRAERIRQLTEESDFSADNSPLGLIKVANRMLVTAKKKKEAKEEEGTEGVVADVES